MLDGKDITDVERQFLKNWKVMRNPELRLVAPPGDSASAQLSAGTPTVTVSSGGTRQQSMLIVSARQSTSESTGVEMAMVPCNSAISKQPLYYDSQLIVFGICFIIFTGWYSVCKALRSFERRTGSAGWLWTMLGPSLRGRVWSLDGIWMNQGNLCSACQLWVSSTWMKHNPRRLVMRFLR